MPGKHQYLAKNIILFGISNFIPKLLAMLLVPLFTHYLSTAEYGVSDLILTTVTLLIPLFTLSIHDAVLRFALDKHYRRDEVFSIALLILFSGFGLICLGTWVLSLFRIEGIKNSYLLFFLLTYGCESLYQSVTLFCRGIEKVPVVVTGNLLQSLVYLCGSLLFLPVFHWGLEGYLLAHVLGSIAALIWCFAAAKLHRYLSLNVSKAVFLDMVRFSFPLIFSVLAWWVSNYFNRFVLTWMHGIAVSGLFAAANKIPTILSAFQQTFAQAWSISAIREFDPQDSDGFIGTMYSMMTFAMCFCCSALILVNRPLSYLLLSGDFFVAWRFVPPLLIAVVFHALSLFFNSIFLAVRDSKTLSLTTVLGAAVSLLCNFPFIYFWGAYGAALANMLGYFVVLLLCRLNLKKHLLLRIDRKKEWFCFALLFLQLLLSFFEGIHPLLQLPLCLLIPLLYLQELLQLLAQAKQILSNKKTLGT